MATTTTTSTPTTKQTTTRPTTIPTTEETIVPETTVPETTVTTVTVTTTKVETVTTTHPPTPTTVPSLSLPPVTTAVVANATTLPAETQNVSPVTPETPATPGVASLPHVPETVAGIPYYLLVLLLVTVPIAFLLYHDAPALAPGTDIGMPVAKRVLALVLYLAGSGAFLYALVWFWYDMGSFENGSFPAFLLFIITPVTAYMALSSLALAGTVVIDRSPSGLLKWHSGVGSLSFLAGASSS